MRLAGAVLAILSGCGEVERLDLLVRPRVDDFEAHVQPLLEQVGCSNGQGCHEIPSGDLLFVVGPDRAELEDNYLGIKAVVDLDAPDDSILLADLLSEDQAPGADHPQVCWASRDACSYRKLRAWVAWQQDGDPRPQDVDCDASGETCRRR